MRQHACDLCAVSGRQDLYRLDSLQLFSVKIKDDAQVSSMAEGRNRLEWLLGDVGPAADIGCPQCCISNF